MNNYEQPLIEAGMKSVDAFQLASQIRGYLKEGRILVVEKIIDAAMHRHGANPEIYATLVDLRMDTQADHCTGIAQQLVDAVQALDTQKVRSTIAMARKQMDEELKIVRARKDGKGFLPVNLVDSELPGNLGFTALHVACANYKMRPNERILLNEIIGILIEAGACPWKPMGEKWQKRMIMGQQVLVLVDPGKTIPQVCGQDLAPSFKKFLADFEDSGGGRVESYAKYEQVAA